MNLQIIAKKIEKQWEAALISDNQFRRAFTGTSLKKIVESQISAILSFDRPEGTEISVQLNIIDPPQEEKKSEPNPT